MSEPIDLSNSDVPLRTFVRSPEFYADIDPGIRFAVRALHAQGIETCQSCQGGPGHAYDRPSVDLLAGARDADGFSAVAALVAYGLPLRQVSQVWGLDALGRPYETIWRIEFACAFPEKAADPIMFYWGYQAQPMSADDQ